MSFLASIMRKKELMMMRSEAQWQVSLFGAAIMALQKSCSDLLQVGTDYEADSVMAKKLQARQAKLKVIEQQLEQKKSTLELQIKQYDAEIESCKAVIDKKVTQFFQFAA